MGGEPQGWDYLAEPEGMKTCTIQEIENVPIGAIAFIGHAYGDAYGETPTMDSFLSQNVSEFLSTNSHLLSSIIFTGDLFRFPSMKKWRKLDNEFGTNLNIYIAPGNHDVERPAERDVFEQSVYGSIQYPHVVSTKFGQILLEDSVSSNWSVPSSSINIINSQKYNIAIVGRHNIPIKELAKYSNSPEGWGVDMDTISSLKDKIPDNKIIWIIGDGGKYDFMPRMKCLSVENHMFIINGIGEVKGDSVILLSNGNLYSYTIDEINTHPK
tara:strand:+ start:319 stop:1125 length:807 start_codon:yes stop_codon:yes gene_type:complete